MKSAIFVLLAVTMAAGSSGCCCLDRLFCGGCRGSCGYGHEGPACDSCGGMGGGGCSDCTASAGPAAGRGPSQAIARRRPAAGHPLVHQRRDADGEYEFAAGPPTGATTYPYYTNRGPRDFLAKNPQSIGP
jgi:hypothetical protein